MKTVSNIFDYIVDDSNIMDAYYKASYCRHNSFDYRVFDSNLYKNLSDIKNAVITGSYKVGNYKYFRVYEPKERLIMKLPPFDRVVQHMWNNIVTPIIDRRFIYNSYACRNNKGNQLCALNIQREVYKINVCYGQRVYYLKGDIHSYFKSIDHNILKNEFMRFINDPKVLDLTFKFIDSNGNLGKGFGIPVGNLSSQIFANIYGNKLDKFCVYDLGLNSHYYRYMDDIAIISTSYNYLNNIVKPYIEYFVNTEMNMEINKDKFYIDTIDNKNFMDFVGFKIYSDRVNPKFRSIKSIYNTIEQLINGTISVEEFCLSYPSKVGFIKNCNSRDYINGFRSTLINSLLDDFYYSNYNITESEFMMYIKEIFGNYYKTIFED